MTLTVPNTFASGATIASADMNANFDAIEAWGNAIPVADLADAAAGQFIIASGTGVPTYRSLTGPVAISNTGVTTLAGGDQANQVGTQALTATVWAGCAALTLAVGTYWVWGKVNIESSSSANVLEAQMTQDGVTIDVAKFTNIDDGTIPLGPNEITVASGTDVIWVEARSALLGATASYGRIAALRVA